MEASTFISAIISIPVGLASGVIVVAIGAIIYSVIAMIVDRYFDPECLCRIGASIIVVLLVLIVSIALLEPALKPEALKEYGFLKVRWLAIKAMFREGWQFPFLAGVFALVGAFPGLGAILVLTDKLYDLT